MKGFFLLGGGGLLIGGSTSLGRGLVIVGGVVGLVTSHCLGSSGLRVGGPSLGVASQRRGGPGLRVGRIWLVGDVGWGGCISGLVEGGRTGSSPASGKGA
ncbi:hypothetical protein TIFTF001_051558 [Ficus carica]|uniref:Uncharacterized protein n=1 Tax=Ficus carica TaxID=3494 RepID=A0AA87Z0D8_FICCA|nr:hypothetical protein TIFTF001_051558 [Ficus carica]